jgi:predicted transcriptional regulator
MEILAEILQVVRNGARKTRIMYQANLSFSLMKRYLDYALEAELIATPPENNCYYFATPKGREFLERYDKYLLRNKQLEDQQRAIDREKAILNESYVSNLTRNSVSKEGKALNSSAQ